MSITFNTYKNMSNDVLQNAVINKVTRTSDLLGDIPVEIINSLMYRFNVSDYQEELQFVDAGEGFLNGTVETEAEILELKHLGVYADVPLQMTYQGSNVADLRANVTELKAENMAKTLETAIFYADGTNKSFKGFNKYIAEGRGTKVAKAIDYDALCEVVDACPKANKIYMNRKTLRQVEKALANEGFVLGSVLNGGETVKSFNNIPIFDTETIKDGEIFVLEMSDQGCGLLATGELLNVQDMGLLDSKPVYRTMIQGSYAPIVRQPRALAKLEVPLVKTLKK